MSQIMWALYPTEYVLRELMASNATVDPSVINDSRMTIAQTTSNALMGCVPAESTFEIHLPNGRPPSLANAKISREHVAM